MDSGSCWVWLEEAILSEPSSVKRRYQRGIFLADDHSGIAFHVFQSVGVKIHQEPPDAGPQRWEGEFNRHFLAWCHVPTEKQANRANDS